MEITVSVWERMKKDTPMKVMDISGITVINGDMDLIILLVTV